MLPTLVTIDAAGESTGPAITWEDGRAEHYGDRYRETLGADSLYRRTGQWVDGRYLLPMWERVRATDPERAARTAMLLGAKDFVVGVLTDSYVTDPSTATGFGCWSLAEEAWDPELRAAVEGLPTLPEVVHSDTLLPLSPAGAERLGLPVGLPVCVGAADSVLGALGMGVRHPGDIAYVAGTSTVVLGVSATPTHDPLHRFLVTPMATRGTWGLEMDLLSTGGAIRWLSGLLGILDERTALALAAEADGDATSSPVFLPYVAPGEQGALWDPNLTGTISGLTLGHGRGDIVRALVTGILVESVRCLRTLESMGFESRPLRVAGGSASEDWFRQQLADSSGRTVLAPVDGDSDYSALGAAALTASAVTGESPWDSVAAMSSTIPDPATEPGWSARTARHELARWRVATT